MSVGDDEWVTSVDTGMCRIHPSVPLTRFLQMQSASARPVPT